jgi:hypothetical protein
LKRFGESWALCFFFGREKKGERGGGGRAARLLLFLKKGAFTVDAHAHCFELSVLFISFLTHRGNNKSASQPLSSTPTQRK